MPKQIPLTQGKYAIVDDEYYDLLTRREWHYRKDKSNGGYAVCWGRENGKRILIRMHRVLSFAPDGVEVDHINGNKLDNRLCNLRLVSRAQNNYNRAALANSSSRFKGVTWRKDNNKWRAKIRINGKDINLGQFESEIEAAKAYNIAATELFGQYSRLNKI